MYFLYVFVYKIAYSDSTILFVSYYRRLRGLTSDYVHGFNFWKVTYFYTTKLIRYAFLCRWWNKGHLFETFPWIIAHMISYFTDQSLSHNTLIAEFFITKILISEHLWKLYLSHSIYKSMQRLFTSFILIVRFTFVLISCMLQVLYNIW